MSLNDYLKCPGLELTLTVTPEEYPCTRCGRLVEIWTDELKRRCTDCGMVVFNPNPMIAQITNDSAHKEKVVKHKELMGLTKQAIIMGATDAALIASSEIRIEAELAVLCSGDPPCKNFGKAPSCPPHVGGPGEFIKWRDKSPYTIVVRIDVPTEIMFSEEQREVMRLLQENLAALERATIDMGFTQSKAFAGGSCKKVWCFDHPTCRVLSKNDPCRYPDKARPSMSGYGVNVTKLMESAGLLDKIVMQKDKTKPNDSLWIAGLVLIME
jgi:predicted metal-binding protein